MSTRTNEHLEAGLRSALSSVERAPLSTIDQMGERVVIAERRRARRRRASAAVAAVGLTGAAIAAVWTTSSPRPPLASESKASSSVAVSPPTPGWAAIPVGPHQSATGASVVWTGTEAWALGGSYFDGQPTTGVVAFDPTTSKWRVVSAEPVPVVEPIVHWAGDRLLAVGVLPELATTVAATLDLEGQWTIGAAMPFGFKGGAPTPSAWTGTSLLLMSGETPVAYDMASDEWRFIEASPIAARRHAASVWTGKEWVVWGGLMFESDLAAGDGAAYDPSTDEWRVIADSPLSARLAEGVWSGEELIVMAGRASSLNGIGAFGDGAAYDPTTDSWRSLADGPAHPGAELVGTQGLVLFFAKGAYSVYRVDTDEWMDGVQGAGVCFDAAGAVSTGSQIIALGCYDGSTGGAVFTPE